MNVSLGLGAPLKLARPDEGFMVRQNMPAYTLIEVALHTNMP